ncbi:MAG: elongation factor P [Planctomycetes bacterium]|nr:elongation factor P [Planctomycetota bacterium]
MASYNTSEFRKGLKVLIDNEPYLMIDMEFMKPGKGQAVYRTKLKNLLRGNVIDRNYRSGDSIDAAEIEEHSAQYLYNDSKNWFFMNPESFEQFSISKEILGDLVKFLKDGTTVEVMLWNGRAISIEPPKSVDLQVTYTEPAARGNTATNVQKSATVETGAEVFVPAFINIGDVVKVDTRTGEYIERAAKS